LAVFRLCFALAVGGVPVPRLGGWFARCFALPLRCGLFRSVLLGVAPCTLYAPKKQKGDTKRKIFFKFFNALKWVYFGLYRLFCLGGVFIWVKGKKGKIGQF
jgi:hypothetical protein